MIRTLLALADILTGNRETAERETAYRKPLPNVGLEPHAEPFWEGLNDEEFRLQRCGDCERYQYFPRPWCHYCGSETLAWEAAAGTGRVISYAIVRQPVTSRGFSEEVPYVTAYVALEEGPTVFTKLENCEIDEVENDMAVTVSFDRVTESVTLFSFEPQPRDCSESP